MAAALVLPISGPYIGTYNAFALGTQNDDGFVLSANTRGQEISASDAYGETLVEGIYRGVNWRCRIRGLEWNKRGLLDALLAFGQPNGSSTFGPSLQNVGDRMSTYAKSLLLTAILSNPPSTPQTLTASSCILAPGQTTEMMFTSKMREMPIEWVFLPYSTTISATTFNVPFTITG